MQNEQAVRNLLELKFSRDYHNCVLWANPSGNGVVGKIIKSKEGVYTVKGQRAKFGGPDGCSDFIGASSIEITPEMVGKNIAVTILIETKPEGWRPPTICQKNSWKTFTQQYYFIRAMRALGCYAGFASSESDIIDIMQYDGVRQEEYLDQLEKHIEAQENRARG